MKNCDRGLENAALGHSFSLYGPTYFVYSREKTHVSVTVTVVRDRKIRTALRTNQIAEFVTVTAWKKNKEMFLQGLNPHSLRLEIIKYTRVKTRK